MSFHLHNRLTKVSGKRERIVEELAKLFKKYMPHAHISTYARVIITFIHIIVIEKTEKGSNFVSMKKNSRYSYCQS